MKGFDETLQYFGHENLTLEVPFFQRPYVWDEDNWQSLIESINGADPNTMPFLGSLILKEKGDKKYWVIDGQQRITTLSIMSKVLLDIKRNQLHPRTITKLEDIIFDVKTIDSATTAHTVRLIPSNADAKAYELVMAEKVDMEELEKDGSHICKCYLYFFSYIKSLSEERFKTFLDKLVTSDKYLIFITLGNKDDEQAIFDTVNSLGKKLTNSDIVKNYLYQKMKSLAGESEKAVSEVVSHYEKYWGKVFIDGEMRGFWDERISLGRITTTHLDAFLKDYATVKGIYIPSESGGIEGLAKDYKKRIDSLDLNSLRAFSMEISSYAKNYYEMWRDYGNCENFKIEDRLNSTLLILDQMETSTFNPYILKLISSKDPALDEKLFGLQRFLLKRYLWKATKKNFNKCCLEVLNAQNPNEYFDKYNENSDGTNWASYPYQIKNMPNKQATLLLFIIEMIRRRNNDEDKYDDYLVYNKSLEHIMPKKWKENWQCVQSKTFDDNGNIIDTPNEEIDDYRRAKICSLGNMTLLKRSLNTSISNGEFKSKIEGNAKKKGIRVFVGSLSVAQEIVDQYDQTQKWDEIDISRREFKLVKELNEYYQFVPKIEWKNN